MPDTPVMSAIKGWFRQETQAGEDRLIHMLTGFSLGVWMGAMHPEVMVKLEDEMAAETGAHNELIEELFEVIYPDA